jgi:hypothetical protein
MAFGCPGAESRTLAGDHGWKVNLRQLISDVATANRTWAEERIAAELLLKAGVAGCRSGPVAAICHAVLDLVIDRALSCPDPCSLGHSHFWSQRHQSERHSIWPIRNGFGCELSLSAADHRTAQAVPERC